MAIGVSAQGECAEHTFLKGRTDSPVPSDWLIPMPDWSMLSNRSLNFISIISAFRDYSKFA